ncbi:Uncharacterized protein SCF082_LOCUS1062 [Durusdinium trenchii]|uniref:Uncharacterized protein n=1 Tax=Durusdinium trenchii TaxID=1381693 RepID=A0ABP0HBP9_9DINO
MEWRLGSPDLATPLQALSDAARQASQVTLRDELAPKDTRGQSSSQVWEEIVQAALCWTDVADAELFIAVNVFSMLSWVPMCAFRACHHLTANAFEHWAAHPQPRVTLSWVRIPLQWQSDCLRFIGQHCRNVRQLSVRETAHFEEKQLLRLVCGMRLLECLEVDASSFGGSFPDPQRIFSRLAKYCPRLQHLVMSFRPDVLSERILFEVRTLACLGRRLLTLDLGLSVQLYQFQADVENSAGYDLSTAADMDLAPVDWDDSILEGFMTQAF